MPNYYEPDLASNPDDPFARGEDGKLVRRGFWLDMSDRSIVLALTKGVGAQLRAEEKRLHLLDIGRDHLIDDIIQEVLPPEK
ncbi:MAG: hypothetical protein CMF71_00975 [Magnetovibrio sp.]|nr:hypothetical protein [Magnetovibrio sp.]|tara:strand:+ start:4037 stop:4282 length:246 start_codon:yes stop_codon:yes gene_type:complete